MLMLPPVIVADFDDSLLATTFPFSSTLNVPLPLLIFNPVRVRAVIKLATKFPSIVHAFVYGPVFAEPPSDDFQKPNPFLFN